MRPSADTMGSVRDRDKGKPEYQATVAEATSQGNTHEEWGYGYETKDGNIRRAIGASLRLPRGGVSRTHPR
jgi:hypothetical protein